MRVYELNEHGHWTGNSQDYSGGRIQARWIPSENVPIPAVGQIVVWVGNGLWDYIPAQTIDSSAPDLRPVIDIQVSSQRAVVNQPVSVQVTIYFPDGVTVASHITDTFSVPLMGYDGKTEKSVKLVSFTNGKTADNFSLKFKEPGFYRVTEFAINLRLPDAYKMRLKQEVEIVVHDSEE